MTEDVAPWASSPHSYAGWVPNVGSHLSFSLIGSGRGPSVSVFGQGFDGRTGRMACVLQRRETDDFLLPRWLSRRIWPDIVQHWLLVGSTKPVSTHVSIATETEGRVVEIADDEQGVLYGTTYMLPHQASAAGATSLRWALEEARALIEPAPRRSRGMEAMRSRSDAEMDRLVSDLDRIVRWRVPGAMRVEFALMRTGELRLWFAAATLELGVPPQQLWILARQAYFFIKDMVHHHTHHEPSSDQITPLVPVGTSRSRMRNGEENWRRQTIWSLSRAAEVLIRSGGLSRLRQAMGILAYADAFQKTLLPYVRDGDSQFAFAPNETVYAYDYAHIKESTRVQIDQAQATRTHRTTLGVAFLASSIGGLSLLSSLISTRTAELKARTPDGVPSGLIHLRLPAGVLESLARKPVLIVFCMSIAVALISDLVSDDGQRLLRHGPRKVIQIVRGLSLSAGRRAGLGAVGTHRLLIGLLSSSIVALVTGIVWAAAVARAIVGAVGLG